MLARRQWLEEKMQALETQLSTLPEGKLCCARNENRFKWYHSDGHTSTYLPKKERKLAEQLAMKKYLSLTMEDLRNEKKAIDLYLKHYELHVGKAEQLLQEKPEYRELLSSYPYYEMNVADNEERQELMNQEIHKWLNTSYRKNPYFLEQLTHKTLGGYCVRSKSEAVIDTALRMHKIPFRYECELVLGESTVYPDFTIKHPRNGKISYWEHFGRMDDPSYYHKAFQKLQVYTMHDIVPGIQLITTYETTKHPLSIELVENIIKYHFT